MHSTLKSGTAMLKLVSFLAFIGMSAAFAPSFAPLRSARAATSPRSAISGLRAARSSGSFPAFLPKEMVGHAHSNQPRSDPRELLTDAPTSLRNQAFASFGCRDV